MFDPDWDEGCPTRSFLTDNIGHLAHPHARDYDFHVTLDQDIARPRSAGRLGTAARAQRRPSAGLAPPPRRYDT